MCDPALLCFNDNHRVVVFVPPSLSWSSPFTFGINQKCFCTQTIVYCFRRASAPRLKLVMRTSFCLLHLLADYWWVSPMLNTIFSIFSSFFRMFDFTVDILSSCYEKNMTIRLKYHCLFTVNQLMDELDWIGYININHEFIVMTIRLIGNVYLFTDSCRQLCEVARERLQRLQKVIIVFTNTSMLSLSLLLYQCDNFDN